MDSVLLYKTKQTMGLNAFLQVLWYTFFKKILSSKLQLNAKPGEIS